MATIDAYSRQETVAKRWARFRPIRTGDDYIESLRNQPIDLYCFGNMIANPVDHPIIRPSIEAMKAAYDLAIVDPDLATAQSPLIGGRVNHFLHIVESSRDLVMKSRLQRRLSQTTGTCFQRCVGLATLSTLHSMTYEINQKHGTSYHNRFIGFLELAQENNIVLAGGMTDTKGDRSKRPSEQSDPDLFMHVVRRTPDGLYIRGAKAHVTGDSIRIGYA